MTLVALAFLLFATLTGEQSKQVAPATTLGDDVLLLRDRVNPTALATTRISATPSVSLEPPPLFTIYEVQVGDTVCSIAAQHGLQPESVVWNNVEIGDDDGLAVGQLLRLPATDGVLHEMRVGETLVDVAARYGVDLSAITTYTSNGIETPDDVEEMQLVFVPGGIPPGENEAAADCAGSAAVTNPMDCDVIRGTEYLSPEERDWYLHECLAPTPTAAPQTIRHFEGPEAPLVPGVNLVANPSFEEGTTGPLGWRLMDLNGELPPTWDTFAAHEGTKSVRIDVPSAGGGVSGWHSDPIPVDRSKDYCLSVWTRATPSLVDRLSVVLMIRELDSRGNEILGTGFSWGGEVLSTEWTERTTIKPAFGTLWPDAPGSGWEPRGWMPATTSVVLDINWWAQNLFDPRGAIWLDDIFFGPCSS